MNTVRICALAMGAIELVMTAVFVTGGNPGGAGFALFMAAIFFIGAWRLSGPGRHSAALIVLVLALLIEVVFLPTYPRVSTFDWVVQSAVAVVGIIGLVAGTLELVARRRFSSLEGASA